MKSSGSNTATPEPRKGMPDPKLTEAEFKRRYLVQFVDPGFRPLDGSLDEIADIAWQAYSDSRKAPIIVRPDRNSWRNGRAC
jgi:hypothetical protein